MTFDAGTWWLLTVIVTTVVGLVGFLFGRSVFRQLDENRADIKEVRENYTPRTDHQKDLEAVKVETEAVNNKSAETAWMITLQLGSSIIPPSIFDFMK